jgi:hypothetical protein
MSLAFYAILPGNNAATPDIGGLFGTTSLIHDDYTSDKETEKLFPYQSTYISPPPCRLPAHGRYLFYLAEDGPTAVRFCAPQACPAYLIAFLKGNGLNVTQLS